MEAIEVESQRTLWSSLVEAVRGSHQDYTAGSLNRAILLLAVPMVLEMVLESLFAVVDVFWVGRLGANAVATVGLTESMLSLVFAVAMGLSLSTTAMVARRIGEKDPEGAAVAGVQAIALGLIVSVAIGIPCLIFAPRLLQWMGASAEIVAVGGGYARICLGGSGAVLLLFLNNAIFRGAGDAAIAMRLLWVSNIINLVLDPCLIFGWGPFPRLGVAGGAVAVLAYYAVGSVALAMYLWTGRSVVRLSLHGVRFRWGLFRDILRVGAVAALITVQTNLTIAVATGLVGRFGSAAIAGFGTGSRLEYLLVPLVFGLGGPLVAMVGTNVGAGQRGRALRAAWIGAAIAAGLTELIGLWAAMVPRVWLSLFDTDPAMLDAGSRYLHVVGPFYGLFGLGMALYFASQGAGRLLWPLLANLMRLVIAAGGGWLVLRWTGNVSHVFAALSAALTVFGLVNAAAVAGGAWFGRIGWPNNR